MKCWCNKTMRKAKDMFGDTEDYWHCGACDYDICSVPCFCCVDDFFARITGKNPEGKKITALKNGQTTPKEFKKIMGKYLTEELKEELKEHLEG